MMVGRDVNLVVSQEAGGTGQGRAVRQGSDGAGRARQPGGDGVSFEVCAGEVLGVAGVQGNGQTELVYALTGLRAPIAGEVAIGGSPVVSATPT
jgi:general nucleoside transport system ATP-binding protein